MCWQAGRHWGLAFGTAITLRIKVYHERHLKDKKCCEVVGTDRNSHAK